MSQEVSTNSKDTKKASSRGKKATKKNKHWKKPVLEDVSGKVMAQPYIRFT